MSTVIEPSYASLAPAIPPPMMTTSAVAGSAPDDEMTEP